MADKGQADSPKSKAAAAREARLKSALRANLHRRKGQSRVRKDADQTGDIEE